VYLGCQNNQLTTLDVSGLSALVYLDCDTNQLTTLDVSGLSALVYLDCDTNQLTLDAVNGILAALVANGQANGYLNMSGGTNASPTDSADEATLLANGWTVTTN
jgi:Leucine-rich repeat (LRR) protein